MRVSHHDGSAAFAATETDRFRLLQERLAQAKAGPAGFALDNHCPDVAASCRKIPSIIGIRPKKGKEPDSNPSAKVFSSRDDSLRDQSEFSPTDDARISRATEPNPSDICKQLPIM
jgi:hypothetical protein